MTRVLHDLSGLLLVHGVLLATTFLLSRADAGDLRVQLAWTAFLLPGWCLSATWTSRRSRISTRYVHAVIGAIGVHACLAALGAAADWSFRGYYLCFGAVTLASLGLRWQQLARLDLGRRASLPTMDWLVWGAILLLVVSVYRQPRSADIVQFSLQQQDMTESRSMQPSAIGMAAMEVEEAMPRWRSQLWHLVPCLIADTTSLPVDGVLRRWAPIPIGFSSIAVLIYVIRRLAGRRVPLWAAALAVWGPVVLWYRAYHAFNYSFRLTNSFCLDKDLCLFLVIPATIYLSVRWIRGQPRSLMPLVMMIPAIMKFHPMTSVYLVLLVPYVLIGFDRLRTTGASDIQHDSLKVGRRDWPALIPSKRAMLWVVLCGFLFLIGVLIGDAQTAHEQISGIVAIDWQDHQTGRPLHYWVGHYASIQDHGLLLDTTEWQAGRLTLRARVLLNCGLLGALHAVWLLWMISTWRRRNLAYRRLWWATTIVLAMLWGLWLVAPTFLAWKPHFLAGYERLHWFAYVPALVALSVAATITAQVFSRWLARLRATSANRHAQSVRAGIHPFWNRLAAALVAILIAYSALAFRLHHESLWAHVPRLNSLLDFELPDQVEREASYDVRNASRPLQSRRPKYLRDDDRVLFLDNRGNDQYLLIKQGVFWSEPYAEAFAWQLRGDEFLEDRWFFYRLLDRLPVEGADLTSWLDQKRVTVLTDRRPGADSYLAELVARHDLGFQQQGTGVWRREPLSP